MHPSMYYTLGDVSHVARMVWFSNAKIYGFDFSLVIGVPITSLVLGFWSSWREKKYSNWKLKLILRDGTNATYSIYTEDIKRMEGNDFDLWRNIVKSTVSTFGTLTHTDIAQARKDGWLVAPAVGGADRLIIIDFTKIPTGKLKYHENDDARPSGRYIGITRHSATSSWLQERIPSIEIFSHLDDSLIDKLKIGDTVVGVLPINIVEKLTRRKVIYQHFTLDLPETMRGKELTKLEIEQFGARLEAYAATTVKIPKKDF